MKIVHKIETATWIIRGKKIIAVIDATFPVSKRKPEKKIRLIVLEPNP